ncbi:SHD1 domain-containing protein [Pontiellaceae bacterium B12227]|nr:SHD1 domain-containing protein [Pontiellaceae bacterium B12227]
MKRIRKDKGVVKGAPSGFVVSLAIHAAVFLLAGMLVVFNVVTKEEKKFVPPKPVDRPKMKLKKPKVKMKKSAKPKSTTRIVTKVQKANMPDIQLPEMSGMGDGLAGGLAGFDIVPDMTELSVFGGGQSIGNDFEGRCYFFKYDRQGGDSVMDSDKFIYLLREFCAKGWRESRLNRYYRTPDKLYTRSIMVPPVNSTMAADVFGQPDMESYWFFAKYKGQLVYPEDIRFRFWGAGDAFLVVNVDGENVLINGVRQRLEVLDFWQSTDADNDKYFLANKPLRIGDWIELKAGEPLDLQVLFGEYAGGSMTGMLLVEVDGADYPQTRQGGPLLPAFKTEEFTRDQLEMIRKYLPEGECSLTNGPVFRDYFASAKGSADVIEKESVTEPEPRMPENKMRVWSLTNGKTVEAEYVTLIGGKVVLKTKRGKQVKLPGNEFSEADLKYIDLNTPPELDLNFAKTSKQRIYPDILWVGDEGIPGVLSYDFKLMIKQKSSRLYSHELKAEYFAIGKEIDGDKRILLDYQQKSIHLTEGSRSMVEMTGNTVELEDYFIQGFHRGEKYKGFLGVVTDSRGKIIAYKTSSENLFENLDNLRRVPLGKYFDDDGNRCQPTRLKSIY